jgi:putative NADH-flavin reductase
MIMKLLIFGSTGRMGGHLVTQALEQGHEVTAFVRDPSKISVTHKNLKIFQGNVMNPSDVARAMPDHDAVLVALGSGRKGNVRSEGTRNVINAMERTGIQRLICQTTLGAGDSADNLNFFWKHIMFGWFLKEAYADHQTQEAYIMQSKLKWTIVRPAAFTDGPVTGNYRHGFASTDKNITLKISCADIAHFMLKQLNEDHYLRKTPGLSY